MKNYFAIIAAAVFAVTLICAVPKKALCAEDQIMSAREIMEELDLADIENSEGAKIFYRLTGYSDIKSLISDIIEGKGSLSLSKLWENTIDLALDEAKKSVSLFFSLVGICLVGSLLGRTGIGEGKAEQVVFYIIYFALCSVVLIYFKSSCERAKTLLSSLLNFMNISVPFMLLGVVLSGGSLSGAMLSPGVLLMSDIMGMVISEFLIPLCVICFMLTIVENAFPEHGASNFKVFLEKMFSFVLGAGFIIFTGVLSFEGITFAAIDNVRMQGARYALKFIPVVGNFLSGSIELAGGFLLAITNTFGLIGAIIVLCLTLYPALSLIGVYLAFALSAAVCQPFTDKKISGCVMQAAMCMQKIISCCLVAALMVIVGFGVLSLISSYLYSVRV